MSLSDEIIGVIILSSFAFVILTVYLCKCYYDCTIGKQISKKKKDTEGQEVNLIPMNNLMADVQVTLDPYDDNDDKQFSRACHNDLDMVALSLHTFNRKQSLRQSHQKPRVAPGTDPNGVVGLWKIDSDPQDVPMEIDFPGESEYEFSDPKTLSVPVQVHQTHSLEEPPADQVSPTCFEAKAPEIQEKICPDEQPGSLEETNYVPLSPQTKEPASYEQVMATSLPITDSYVQSGIAVATDNTSENVAPNHQENDNIFFVPETTKSQSTRKGRRKSKGTLQTLDDCLEPSTRKKSKKPKAENKNVRTEPPPLYTPMSPGLGRSSQI